MLYRHSLGTLALLAIVPAALGGQTRSRQQDSTLDHFRHPAGTQTVAFGTLGDVRKLGEGPRTMVLIPGLGFGSGIWTEFMERHRAHYTMYAVTLPGFGGTPPLAAPSGESRFAEIPWTRSAIVGIRRLLDRERIDRVTIVAHWALATQIALHLALDDPERVEAVVLIGGVSSSTLLSLLLVPVMYTLLEDGKGWVARRLQWRPAFGWLPSRRRRPGVAAAPAQARRASASLADLAETRPIQGGSTDA